MLCCMLARVLTRDKSKAVIINADPCVPMIPVWLPGQTISENASIGQVLSSVEIDAALAASHVTILQSWPYVGVMGYAAGENPLSYPELKYEMALELIRVMETIVDYVILDCSEIGRAHV